MITILGYNISIVKPKRINTPIIYRDERPTIKYSTKPKTIEEHSGRVIAVVIKLKSGEMKSINFGTHADIINTFGCDPEDVEATGWKLENGNYIWR